MQLLVDIGNTALKWGLWRDQGLAQEGRIEHNNGRLRAEDLQVAFAGLPRPSAVKVSNVSGDAVGGVLTRACERLWGVAPQFARSLKSAYGVTIAYERPGQLGVDRWLAMLAARHHVAGPVLVVDCGTAVTLDTVDTDGAHLGGQIAPGVRSQWAAVFSRTRVPAEAYVFNPQLLGCNTAECVAAGAVNAVAGLIERSWRTLPEQAAGHWRIVMTGGDAGDIAPLLTMPVELRPHLVFEGLALWQTPGLEG